MVHGKVFAGDQTAHNAMLSSTGQVLPMRPQRSFWIGKGKGKGMGKKGTAEAGGQGAGRGDRMRKALTRMATKAFRGSETFENEVGCEEHVFSERKPVRKRRQSLSDTATTLGIGKHGKIAVQQQKAAAAAAALETARKQREHKERRDAEKQKLQDGKTGDAVGKSGDQAGAADQKKDGAPLHKHALNKQPFHGIRLQSASRASIFSSRASLFSAESRDSLLGPSVKEQPVVPLTPAQVQYFLNMKSLLPKSTAKQHVEAMPTKSFTLGGENGRSGMAPSVFLLESLAGPLYERIEEDDSSEGSDGGFGRSHEEDDDGDDNEELFTVGTVTRDVIREPSVIGSEMTQHGHRELQRITARHHLHKQRHAARKDMERRKAARVGACHIAKRNQTPRQEAAGKKTKPKDRRLRRGGRNARDGGTGSFRHKFSRQAGRSARIIGGLGNNSNGGRLNSAASHNGKGGNNNNNGSKGNGVGQRDGNARRAPSAGALVPARPAGRPGPPTASGMQRAKTLLFNRLAMKRPSDEDEA